MHFTRHSDLRGRRARARSSCGARAPTSGTTRASATSTGWPGCSPSRSGHGRSELADAAAAAGPRAGLLPALVLRPPARRSSWPSGSPTDAPGDLNRVFFTTGGGEAVETAWKLAKQYWKLVGKPMKHKVISRAVAYHGTPQGALSITGIPAAKEMFEPLVPGGFRVPNTNFYRAHRSTCATTRRPSGCGPPTGSRRRSSSRAPTPSRPSSSSRCRTPAAASRRRPGTSSGCGRSATSTTCCWSRDEVICAFGRIGSMFACDDLGYQPDMITCAKGMTSGLLPHRRDASPATASSSRSATGDDVLPARLHLRRPPGLGRGRAGEPRHLRARGLNQHVRENAPRVPGDAREAARPADRRRRPRRRASSTASSWSRTRRPGRPSTTTSPSGCCAASSRRRSSTPACTAAPTTAATPSSSSRRR